MKTLAARIYKIGLLTSVLTSMVACNGGGFHADVAAQVRPPVTSDPATAMDQRALDAQINDMDVPTTIIETQIQRESFMDDLLEKAPAYTDDQIVQDAKDQYQRDIEKAQQQQNDKKKKKPKHNSSAQQADDTAADDTANNDDTTVTQDQPEQQQAQTPQVQDQQPTQKPVQKPATTTTAKSTQSPQTAAPALPAGGAIAATAPKKPAPKADDNSENNDHVRTGQILPAPTKPAAQTPQAPAQQQQKPAAQPAAPAAQKADNSDFCAGLDVAKGQGEADLSDLYNNDDVKLASSMPVDQLKSLTSQAKKNKFVCVLLPIVIRLQAEVYNQRLRIQTLQSDEAAGKTLATGDQAWLADMKVTYGLKANASNKDLLTRVDVVPLALLLSQAALESGWGRSRATHDLKNLFGLHQGNKSEPCEKGYDTHNACVRKFNTIGDSVSAYIKLLNMGSHYEKFRAARAKMRANRQPLNADKLLDALGDYNEHPTQYILDVREIMSHSNNFTQYVSKEEDIEATERP